MKKQKTYFSSMQMMVMIDFIATMSAQLLSGSIVS